MNRETRSLLTKRAVLVACTILLGGPRALAYEYPIHNPLIATVGGGFGVSLNVSERGSLDFAYVGESDSSAAKPAALPRDKAGKVPVQILAQRDPEAPLIYVLPGSTGGTYRSGPARILADYFYDLGFHVITAVSVIQPDFVTAVARDRPIGDAEADANDLYALLSQLKNHAKQYNRVRPRFSAVVGVSLGGFYAARMMMLDKRKRRLGLDRAVLINSPIDLIKSMAVLDKQYSEANYSAVTRSALISALYFKGLEAIVKNPGKDPTPFVAALEEIPTTRLFRKKTSEKVGFVIAARYRRALAKVVGLVQEIRDDGSVPADESRIQRRKRIRENQTRYDFLSFMVNYLNPYLKEKGISIAENMRKSSLKAYRRFLEGSDNIYYINNEDDFLVDREQLRFAKEVFGPSRTKIYPRGGHVGNLWWPENLCYLQKVFADEIRQSRTSSSCKNGKTRR